MAETDIGDVTVTDTEFPGEVMLTVSRDNTTSTHTWLTPQQARDIAQALVHAAQITQLAQTE